MSNEEILASIARDVSDIYGDMFSKRDITIWMTKGLFNRLFPKQFILQNGTTMVTLFGCSIKIVFFQHAEEQWIVGYEGPAKEE